MPTYRNDGSVTYRVQDTDGDPQNVIPGHTVETFDRTVPTAFTLTDDLPQIEKTINASGEDSFTSAIKPEGPFNVSVSGEFTGTVRLVRSFDTFTTVKTVDTFTGSDEAYYDDDDSNAQYKLGVRANELHDGAVTIILSKP